MNVLAQFLVLALCLISSIGFSQKAMESGTNTKKPNLDKFTGNWQWVKGKDTLNVYLKKENVTFTGNVTADVLIGFHTYKAGGKSVTSSYKYVNSDYSQNRYTILATSRSNPNIAHGTFEASKDSHLVDIDLILDPIKNTLLAKLMGREGIKVGTSQKESGIPKEVLLNRQ